MTAQQLVAFVQKALADKWGYVLSGQGETYSLKIAESWAKTRNKPSAFIGTKHQYYVVACARWFGHKVVDCSGLIVEAFRSVNKKYADRKADTFKSQFTEIGAIKTMPEVPGLAVWKKGHIGVYVGGGYAIEARGYKYGVVKTKVKSRTWTHWGKLRDVIYEDTEGDIMINSASPEELISAWQTALINAGYQGKMKLSLIGQWGSNTTAATKAFQKDVGLPQTGVVDGATAAAMWGIGGNAENEQLKTDLAKAKTALQNIVKLAQEI